MHNDCSYIFPYRNAAGTSGVALPSWSAPGDC